MLTLHDAQAIAPAIVSMNCRDARREEGHETSRRGCTVRTWISGVAVGALIVPGHVLHELLQALLVARLLAFAEWPGHGRVA